MNFSNFIKTFFISKSKLIKRKNVDLSMVVYFSPIFLPYKSSKNYFLYCMYQLVKYKPWRDLTIFNKETFNDDEKNSFIIDYENFIKNGLNFDDVNESDINLSLPVENITDDMKLEELQLNKASSDFSDFQELSESLNDKLKIIYFESINQSLILSYITSNFISENEKCFLSPKFNNSSENSNSSNEEINTDDLNPEQLSYFLKVKKHFLCEKSPQFLSLLIGGAGFGKHFL